MDLTENRLAVRQSNVRYKTKSFIFVVKFHYSEFKLFDLVPLENIRQGNAKDKELARKEAELARMQQMLEKMQMQLQQQQNAPSSHQL